MNKEKVTDWEDAHDREFPNWALVWIYDSYGESWTTSKWCDVKDYYARERVCTESSTKWSAVVYEPLVALPTDEYPSSDDSIPLLRIVL
jgi:hypothetical protein